MKTYNILFPTTGRNMGGSHVALLLLIQNLPPHFNPVVLLDEEGSFAEVLKQKGISYHLLPILKKFDLAKGKLKKLLSIPLIEVEIIKILRRLNIQLVQVTDGSLPFLFLIGGRLSPTPVIWHHQQHVHPSWIDRISIFLSKNNIFISDYLRELSGRNGLIIYNAIEKKSKQKEESLSFRIGYFSNLYSNKRPYLILDALKIVKEKGFSFCCDFYGDEREIKYKNIMDEAKINNIADCVKTSSFSPQIDQIMSEMDVVIAPSVDEPFGRTPIEAMSLKVPVVASNHGGHKEIITHMQNGLLFEPDNAEDLAEKVIWIIEHPEEAKSITEYAYNHVFEKYSVDKHVRNFSNIWHKFLSNV